MRLSPEDDRAVQTNIVTRIGPRERRRAHGRGAEANQESETRQFFRPYRQSTFTHRRDHTHTHALGLHTNANWVAKSKHIGCTVRWSARTPTPTEDTSMPRCLICTGSTPNGWVPRQQSLDMQRTPRWGDQPATQEETTHGGAKERPMGKRASWVMYLGRVCQTNQWGAL